MAASAAIERCHDPLRRHAALGCRSPVVHAQAARLEPPTAPLPHQVPWPSTKPGQSQWRQVADTLRDRFPRLAELMAGAREDALVYMIFPRERWAQIASTDVLDKGLSTTVLW